MNQTRQLDVISNAEMISVVIPTLNEATILDSTLSRLTRQLEGHELLIVDGGSIDCTRQVASKYGEVISSRRGRACQMNAGAAVASGTTLLFLHADVWLEPGAVQGVEAAVAAGYIGGAFKQRIEGTHPLYRVIEFAANFRARRLKVFYGDGGNFRQSFSFSTNGRVSESTYHGRNRVFSEATSDWTNYSCEAVHSHIASKMGTEGHRADNADKLDDYVPFLLWHFSITTCENVPTDSIMVGRIP